MKHIHSTNETNESQIDILSDYHKNYKTIGEFYASTVMFLWKGWDSAENTKKYIANAIKKEISICDLKKELTECLKITPTSEFSPKYEDIELIYEFCNEWNNKEIVWRADNNYYYFNWGTTA